MGIKNLNKLLRKHCPQVMVPAHLSEYSFKKIAIDVSLYLCKFKLVAGPRWLSCFINLVACLRKNEVHCVFVYDTGCVKEKLAERKDRADKRAALKDRIATLDGALHQYHLTNEIAPCLVELYKRRRTTNQAPRRLLSTQPMVDMNYVEHAIDRMKNQVIELSPRDFAKSKELFDILKVPYFDAPMEAENMCADLCKRGIVDAVLSEDTDVLAYGAPVFISKLNTSDGTCVVVKYDELLDGLMLESDQFLDLCIMCGTDYNKNIFRVGPEKAYKLIQEHDSIEGVERGTPHDTSILNHERGRSLFRDYDKHPLTSIPFCGAPDFLKLQEFVFRNNLRCSVEGLKQAFLHNTVEFVD